MKTVAFATILLLGILMHMDSAQCGNIPHTISYQGQLSDSSGNPIDTAIQMIFRIYADSSGGSYIWTESHNAVQVIGGLFYVRLGSVSAMPDTLFDDTTRWLGIALGGGSELSPRTKINSIPFSYRILTVNGASGGSISGDLAVTGKVTIGPDNINIGDHSFVAGRFNVSRGDYAVVCGGGGATAADSNLAAGSKSVVGGGMRNKATGSSATITGGTLNLASGIASWIGGGSGNSSSSEGSCVSGGYSNSAVGTYAIICGGLENETSASLAFVGGGRGNTASAAGAVVVGGGGDLQFNRSNEASGVCSFVGSGVYNSASGDYSMVIGGENNDAAGVRSFAAGRLAKADHQGAFVWSDNVNAEFHSSSDNQFNIRAKGGTRIFSDSALTAGVVLSPGASAWASVSDVKAKRNLRQIDGKSILRKLVELPIYQWSYRSQDPSIEHIGPTAQDFKSTFQLGENELTISTIDPPGVALAAVQGLYQLVLEKQAELDLVKVKYEKIAELVDSLLQANHPRTENGSVHR